MVLVSLFLIKYLNKNEQIDNVKLEKKLAQANLTQPLPSKSSKFVSILSSKLTLDN